MKETLQSLDSYAVKKGFTVEEVTNGHIKPANQRGQPRFMTFVLEFPSHWRALWRCFTGPQHLWFEGLETRKIKLGIYTRTISTLYGSFLEEFSDICIDSKTISNGLEYCHQCCSALLLFVCGDIWR